jgi:hypothetical protein
MFCACSKSLSEAEFKTKTKNKTNKQKQEEFVCRVTSENRIAFKPSPDNYCSYQVWGRRGNKQVKQKDTKNVQLSGFKVTHKTGTKKTALVVDKIRTISRDASFKGTIGTVSWRQDPIHQRLINLAKMQIDLKTESLINNCPGAYFTRISTLWLMQVWS